MGLVRPRVGEREPAFVRRADAGRRRRRILWRAGFLPAEHQGVAFNDAEVEPEKMIPNLRNQWLDAPAQRRQLDALQALNQEYSASFGADAFLEGRIKSMEAAYRMQSEAMNVYDIRKEPEAIRAEYGSTPFANGCLMARRLVEAGVRYIHVYYGAGQVWDDHKGIDKNLQRALPRYGPGRRRADPRPEAPRPARQHHGGLGRRVRTHARCRRAATAGTTILTASRCGWPAAGSKAGWRTA